jgi:hypothetical protein
MNGPDYAVVQQRPTQLLDTSSTCGMAFGYGWMTKSGTNRDWKRVPLQY